MKSTETGPITVALVIGELTHGGAERQLYELAIRLDRRRFQPIAVSLSESVSAYGPLLEQAGVEVFALKRYHHFDFRRALSLKKLLTRENARIVHAYLHTATAYTWAARGSGRPYRLIGSVRAKEVWHRGFRHAVYSRSLRGCDRVLVNAVDLADFVSSFFGVDENRIRVVPNGVDASRFKGLTRDAARGRLGVPPKSAIVMTISKNRRAKNIPMLLRAWDVIARAHEGAFLYLVGRGLDNEGIAPLLDSLDDSAKQSIVALGERADISALLSSTDICVLSSDAEGLPNVIMEAMAAGRPVVATNAGGTGELVVNGETGFLVEPGDSEGMASRVSVLLESEALRHEMGRNGRRRIESLYGVTKMVEKTQQLYEEVLQGSGY